MKIRNSLFLIAALVAGLYMTGCTEEDGTPTGSAPTGVEVTSMANNTFGVRWTRASGDVGVNKIIATPSGGGTATEVTTTSTATSGTITVPAAGRYNIMVQSSDGNNSTAVEWATAVRYGTEAAPLRLWETADNTPGHPSGLILSTGTPTSILAGNKLDIDVILMSDPLLPSLPYLSFQGADVNGSGGLTRATRFGNTYYVVAAGLDGDYYSSSFAGEIKAVSDPTAVNYFAIPQLASNPIILLARTADGHYARIEIVKQPTTGLLWGEDSTPQHNRFIDVVVSYQTIADLGYAGRPAGVVYNSINTPRVGGSKPVVKN